MILPSRVSPTARALAVLLALWLALFSPQLFAHRAFLAGDATLFRRFPEFSRQRWLEEHQRTFWNPYVFLGIPSTASLADQRPQYLPDRALDAWERWRGRPGLPPLLGPLLAHLAGILAMGLLARALWGARLEAMIWAGMAWALMPGLIVPLTFGHDAQFASASLIPVLLLLVHQVFASASRMSAAWASLGIGALLGLQCLTGHPQMIAAGAGLSVVFGLERAVRFGRPFRSIGVALGALLGLAIGAAAGWPALLYGALSVRGGPQGVDPRDVAGFSQSGRDLLSLAWPRAVGFGSGTYWGGLRKTDFPQFAGTLICALSLFAWPRRGRRESGVVLALAASALAGVLLSLGSNLAPLDRTLRAHLPLFAGFRVSVAWLIVTHLSLALLSALGLERVTGLLPLRGAMRRSLEFACAAGALTTLMGVTLAWSPLGGLLVDVSREFRPALSLSLAHVATLNGGLDLAWRGLMLTAVSAFWLAGRRAANLQLAMFATLAFHAVDLGSVSLPFLIETAGPIERLAAPAPPLLARAAANDPRARAMPIEPDLVATNDWVAWRARSAVGVHGAVDRDWGDLMAAGLQLHYEALCALAIRYTTTERGTPERPELWTYVGNDGARQSVVRLTRALDRAYCVPRVSAVKNRAAALTAMFAPTFRAADAALAEDSSAAGDYPGSASCRLRWIEDTPDRLRLECDAAGRAFVVIADPMLPGWQANIDGQATPIVRVDYMVRGVSLPPGHHVLEMRYLPPGWAEAAPVTRGAIALALLGAIGLGAAQFGIRRRRIPSR